MSCPRPFHLSQFANFINDFCHLSDRDVGRSVFASYSYVYVVIIVVFICIITYCMSSANRKVLRHFPPTFNPLFSQFNLLYIPYSVAENCLGEMVSPCPTPVLIMIFSVYFCICTVTELSACVYIYIYIYIYIS